MELVLHGGIRLDVPSERLAVILFFGGWHGPIPMFGPDFLDWAYPQGATEFALTGYLANLAGCINFMGKAFLGVVVMMWIRWTLPRLRIDQVMTTCLKYCVPLAAVGFLISLTFVVGEIPFINDIAPPTISRVGEEDGRGRAAVREQRVLIGDVTNASEADEGEAESPEAESPEAESPEGDTPDAESETETKAAENSSPAQPELSRSVSQTKSAVKKQNSKARGTL